MARSFDASSLIWVILVSAMDLSSMAASVGALMRQYHQTIAVAESAAGGLISASLVAVPGAAAYYLGGAVIYTRASQQGLPGSQTMPWPICWRAPNSMHC